MKPLSFKKMDFRQEDILTRLHLKRIIGGHSDSITCTVTQTSPDSTYTIEVSNKSGDGATQAAMYCAGIVEHGAAEGCSVECPTD